ncbi:MAG: nitrogenase cofactor biosynthesis protein NifB [Nitrospinae bacterium]|nr:nitrogenase cofactor biosynthesis protein NifB [Nitrospinota bacterium]
MGNCPSPSRTPVDERSKRHPCYSESASHYYARIHLAVAPACNIQCNYCNRKYDCANESRPGVVSSRLNPAQAVDRARKASAKYRELSVVGIAGPGDAMATPRRTMRTLGMIRAALPDVTLCLSTNGLALASHADELIRLGVEHVTVTLNTFEPDTASEIYSWVLLSGRKRAGNAAMAEFLERQQEGIRAMTSRGALVKVNSVLMPGVNDEEMPAISRRLKLLGVTVHNIMPLIARPEHGTRFGIEGRREPAPAELEAIREKCGVIRQMAHCRQCRADAIGKLDDDQFNAPLPAPVAAGDGADKRAQWTASVDNWVTQRADTAQVSGGALRAMRIAVASKGMGVVNQHFGHAREFYIYLVDSGGARLVGARKVEANYCAGPEECGDEEALLERIIETIADCQAVACLRVGYGPHKALTSRGITPVTEVPYWPLERAAIHAANVTPAASAADTQKEGHAE